MGPAHLNVADVLDQTLTDLINLGLIAKQVHWNLVGPSFGSLHPLFDELADVARDGGDRVAERAVSLGHSPDGRVETAARDNTLPSLDLGSIRDVDAIRAFGTILEIVTTRMLAGIALSADDSVTQGIMTGIADRLETSAWMLRAHGAR
jgi:starvation-inducible DNA-binding protein